MTADNSPFCWARLMFLVLEDDFFLNRESQIFWLFLFRFFFLEISVRSHEKVKTNRLNIESYLAFNKKRKNKRHLVYQPLRGSKIQENNSDFRFSNKTLWLRWEPGKY